jgi:hypothetical protein
MARPSSGYYAADGKRIPGCTTIIKCLDDSEGLIFWAGQLGLQGIDYRTVRDAAANAGTLAHDLIEAEIRGWPAPACDDEEQMRKASNVLKRFKEWHEQTKAVIESHERPMVSEKHRFGGTPDAVATINGRRVLLDWKSSNSVRAPYLAQLGGYAILLEECEGWMPEEAHLLRFDKECESWTHHYWGASVLALGREAFLAARVLYDLKGRLKKAA